MEENNKNINEENNNQEVQNGQPQNDVNQHQTSNNMQTQNQGTQNTINNQNIPNNQAYQYQGAPNYQNYPNQNMNYNQQYQGYQNMNNGPQYQQNGEYQIPEKYRPISAWGYFGYSLLFLLPIAGLILLIVFACDSSNINRRNYARSYFCGLILVAIILIVFLAFGCSTYYSISSMLY